MRQRVRSTARDDPERVLAKAVRLHQAGRLREAEGLYRRLLRKFPGHPQLNANLGFLLKQRGRFAAALKHLHAALAAAPADPELANSLGSLYHDMGRFSEAESWYREAVRHAPRFAAAYNNLACALQDQGRNDEAVAHFRTALELAPDLTGAAFNLHGAIFDDRNPEPAAAVLEEGLRREPGLPLFHFYLGILREMQGDGVRAAQHFRMSELDSADIQPLAESWDYIRHRKTGATRIFGDTFETLAYALDRVCVDGLVLEFGVSFGYSTRFIAGRISGDMHAFDSFEGLPETWKHEAAGRYTTQSVLPRMPANVTLHAGWFSETLPAFSANSPGPIAFMHVDCDLYSSTKTVFDHLGGRVVPGTIIVFDEYLGNQNWREDEFRAFQEAVQQYAWNYEYVAFSLISKQAAVKILA